MKLSKEEKGYLFSKLEYKKKKACIENENDLYKLLKGDKESFTDEEANKIIKSLEFTFRKRLSGTKSDLKNDLFLSIKEKLPKSIILVKQSKINYKPTKSASKKEIMDYLKNKKIDFDIKSTKSKLLGLLENVTHVKRFGEL